MYDEVKFDLAGKLLVEAVEKLDKLLLAMARIALADDFAPCDLQSGEKRGGTVALVIMGHRPTLALFERQARLGAIQGLNLALLTIGLGYRAATPVSRSRRLALRRGVHDVFDLFGVEARLASATCRDFPKAIRTLGQEESAPERHRLEVDAKFGRNHLDLLASSRSQNNLAALGDLLGSAMSGNPKLKLLKIGF